MSDHAALVKVADEAIYFEHIDPDDGTCVCSCETCSVISGELHDCICPDCDQSACGMHREAASDV